MKKKPIQYILFILLFIVSFFQQAFSQTGENLSVPPVINKIEGEIPIENKPETIIESEEKEPDPKSPETGEVKAEIAEVIEEDIKTPLEVISGKRLEMITNLTKTNLEKKISELEGVIKQKNIEISTLEGINEKHKKKIQEIEWEAKKNNENYSQEIQTYKEAIQKNNKALASIQAEKINNELILESLAKVQQEQEEKEDSELTRKIRIILSIIGLLSVIYLGSILVYKYYRKKLSNSYGNKDLEVKISGIIAKMNVVNVLTTLLFGLVLASSVIYLKPELAVGFLFFGSAFIVVFKDALVSFVASIVVLTKFNIGDDILYEYGGSKFGGKITKLSPLNIVIREINNDIDRSAYSGRIISIPNKAIFEQSVIKNSSNYSNYVFNHIDITIKAFYSEANKEEGEAMKSKIEKIEELLEKQVAPLPKKDRGLYGNINKKYKKSFTMNEKETITIKYEWLEERGRSDIKDSILEVLMA